MEGLYFYAISWTIWIVSTFFLNKRLQSRFTFALLTLILIILSPYTFNAQDFTVSYVSVFMVMICLYRVLLLNLKGKCYFFITSLIISIGYVTFELFELFDPVWIVFKREWMLSLLLTYLSIMLQTKLVWRITSVITGCIYGDILFALTIHRYSFPHVIGSMAFLDVCSLTLFMLLTWTGIKVAISYLENQYQTVEREKHKTT